MEGQNKSLLWEISGKSVVVHIHNPSAWEQEDCCTFRGQPGLNREIQTVRQTHCCEAGRDETELLWKIIIYSIHITIKVYIKQKTMNSSYAGSRLRYAFSTDTLFRDLELSCQNFKSWKKNFFCKSKASYYS